MSLQVWLPLCGNTNNQGLANVNVINNGATVNTAGKIGSCYYFLRSTPNYLKIDNCFTTSGNGISMAFWIKIPSNASGNNQIIHIGNGAGWNNNRCTCFIYTGKSTIVFCCGDGNGTTSAYSTMYNCESSAITLNVWTHVACVYTPGTMQIYLNGVLDKTYTTSIVPSFTNVSYIGVAAAPNGGEPATIYLNDVRIYDHALSAMEVSELAKGKMIHLKLSNETIGNPNLLVSSHTPVRTGSYQMHNYSFVSGEEPVEGQTYTIQLKGILGEGKTYFGIYNSGGSVSPVSLYRTDRNSQGIYTKTFTWRTGTAANTFLRVYHMVSDVSATSTIDWIKLEAGSEATPWIPNHTDADYSTTNLTTEYDCSGYRHDATKNAITSVSDSARYGTAAVFNGSSSYVKVNDNTWMADRMPAMTINVWAKVTSSWPTAARVFSCTESGGFNCEAGDSGYWRFPVHVYTSATEASVAYKFDSKEIKLSDLPVGEWVMLTWIYDLTGTRTYINGNLHHTYTNTSYGIHFYTSARLFLGCEASAANPSSPYFNGQLSDFRLYATALSEEDIKILYHTSGFVDNQGNMFVREVKEV